MTYGINIESGERHRCPQCGAIYAISNKDEMLYRNITLLYFSSADKKAELKCKQCKNMIKLKFDELKGKNLLFEQ